LAALESFDVRIRRASVTKCLTGRGAILATLACAAS
jgi:hypothetical protein